MSVRLCGADFGPAPLTLPPSQISQLLGPGAVLSLVVSPSSSSPPSAAAASDAETSVLTVEQQESHQDHEADDVELKSGPAAGITWLPDGSIQLSQNGVYTVSFASGSEPASSSSSVSPTASSRNAFRQAQYLCAVIGTLMLNVLLWLDAANRTANAKDFLINYASDIIAVGSVLIITDVLIAKDVAWDEAGAQAGGVLAFANEFASRMWNGTTVRKVRQRIRTTVGGPGRTSPLESEEEE